MFKIGNKDEYRRLIPQKRQSNNNKNNNKRVKRAIS